MELVHASGGGIYSYDPVSASLTIIADHQRPDHLGKSLRVGEGVKNACLFLGATSAVLWCYDRTDKTWSIQAWAGLGKKYQVDFEQRPPTRGHTAKAVIQSGWLAVPDSNDKPATPFVPDDTPELLERIGTAAFSGRYPPRL